MNGWTTCSRLQNPLWVGTPNVCISFSLAAIDRSFQASRNLTTYRSHNYEPASCNLCPFSSYSMLSLVHIGGSKGGKKVEVPVVGSEEELVKHCTGTLCVHCIGQNTASGKTVV